MQKEEDILAKTNLPNLGCNNIAFLKTAFFVIAKIPRGEETDNNNEKLVYRDKQQG